MNECQNTSSWKRLFSNWLIITHKVAFSEIILDYELIKTNIYHWNDAHRHDTRVSYTEGERKLMWPRIRLHKDCRVIAHFFISMRIYLDEVILNVVEDLIQTHDVLCILVYLSHSVVFNIEIGNCSLSGKFISWSTKGFRVVVVRKRFWEMTHADNF